MIKIGIVGKDNIKSFTNIFYRLVGNKGAIFTDILIIKANYDGLHIEQMEQSGAVFTTLTIRRSFFDDFTLDEDVEFKFSAKTFADRLRKITKNVEAISFLIDNTYLNLEFIANGKVAANHRLSLHELDENDDTRKIKEKAESIPLTASLTLKDKEDIENFITTYVNSQTYNKSQKHLTIEINNIGGGGLLTFKTDYEGSYSEVKTFYHEGQIQADDLIISNYDDEYLSRFLSLLTIQTSFRELIKTLSSFKFEFAEDGPLRIAIELDHFAEIGFLMAPLELGGDEDDDFEDDEEEETKDEIDPAKLPYPEITTN